MTYLAYAGIGSRSAPTHTQNIMRRLGAHLCSEGWTLRSGGARGSDTAFEEGVDDYLDTLDQSYPRPDLKEIYLPWIGFNDNPSQLHPRNYPFSEQELKFAERFHPAWHKCSPSAKLLHTRNVRQILGLEALHGEFVVPSKFVICWTELGAGQGGTGQALRIARSMGIPIFDFGVCMVPEDFEHIWNQIDELQKKLKIEATAIAA